MPIDLISQLEDIKNSPRLIGIIGMHLSRYEANDIIGSFINLMNKNNIECEIYSSDKDIPQLVNNLTRVILFISGISIIDEYNVNNFKDKFMGLVSILITDHKVIDGDNSDSLKGIQGIGPKAAVVMLLKYHNIENLYAYVHEPLEKTNNNILNNKQQAIDCKELATILTDLFNDKNIKEFTHTPILNDKLYIIADLNNLIRTLNVLKHSALINNKIKSVDVLIPKVLQNVSIQQFKIFFINEKIVDIERLGKYIIYKLKNKKYLYHI